MVLKGFSLQLSLIISGPRVGLLKATYIKRLSNLTIFFVFFSLYFLTIFFLTISLAEDNFWYLHITYEQQWVQSLERDFQ